MVSEPWRQFYSVLDLPRSLASPLACPNVQLRGHGQLYIFRSTSNDFLIANSNVDICIVADLRHMKVSSPDPWTVGVEAFVIVKHRIYMRANLTLVLSPSRFTKYL